MLRIRIEIDPGGAADRRRELASAEVSNVSDLADLSSYRVVAREQASVVAGADAWEAMGYISGHNRRQSVWTLVEKVAAWAAVEAREHNRPQPNREEFLRWLSPWLSGDEELLRVRTPPQGRRLANFRWGRIRNKSSDEEEARLKEVLADEIMVRQPTGGLEDLSLWRLAEHLASLETVVTITLGAETTSLCVESGA
jgi:hypothetical protein